MAAGAWFDWTTGDLVTEARFQDIQDSIVFIYATDSAANTALSNKVEGTVYFNTTDNVLKFWSGSAWVEVSGLTSFTASYLVIAGGASGGTGAGTGGAGGGAGGYLNSYASETSGGNSSTRTTLTALKSINYNVTVGAGGASVSGSTTQGNLGNNSNFNNVISYGGGGGGKTFTPGSGGGSGGGGGAQNTNARGGTGLPIQGFKGGDCTSAATPYPTGGGGGASAAGADGSGASGNGGNGLASSITGSSVTRAGGGGGALYNVGTAGTGGTGGGGNGGTNASPAGVAGTVNTGGGGGGAHSGAASGAGGSGIVILRYATADATISVGAGLTSSSATDGSDTVVTFTAGTGTVSFS
jgi:hypothetical protein